MLVRNAYWGEYPLSFAACLGQEECVRLLCANDVDVNRKDTNGNTALHMLVIHEQQVRAPSDRHYSIIIIIIFIIIEQLQICRAIQAFQDKTVFLILE